MNGGIVGLIVGLILGILGVLFGRKMERTHTTVRDSDLVEGAVVRELKLSALNKSAEEIKANAKKKAAEVDKALREAPNEEILARFLAAFGTPPLSMGPGDAAGNGQPSGDGKSK